MPKTAQRVEFVRPKLYLRQFEAIYAQERYSIVEASTKSGKTVGCMCWLAEQAWLGRPGHEYWWVAPIYEQARIVYRRLKRGLTHGTFTPNEKDASLTLSNGAVLRFKGADNPDSLYGEDVQAAVLDEATRIKEDAWFAVRSTLTATRGKVRIIGNVKGRRNWAYRLARRAESGEPDMHYARITAYDAIQAGVLTQHEIDDARAQLPENVFRELYEAEPSDDEGNPFGIDAIRACIEPMHDCPPAVWGWDLARANDWTWGIALCEHGAVCRSERWNQSQYPRLDAGEDDESSSHPQFWEVTLRRIRDLVGRLPAAVDSTGPGGPIDQALNEHRNVEGYVFNQRSKQLLMEGLAIAIQQCLVSFPDGPLVRELESFEYAYTRTGVHYSAPEGMHDDGVCALALAWFKYGQLERLTTLQTLLSTSTRVRYRGGVQGGSPSRQGARNPLEV